MLKNILIPVDDSKLVHTMLKKVAALTDLCKPTVFLVFVSDPFLPNIYAESTLSKYYVSAEDYKKSCQAYADKLFHKAKGLLGDGVECQTVHVYEDDVPEGILRTAQKIKADTIVMASHRYSGIKGVILGNNVHKVIINSKLPVLVL